MFGDIFNTELLNFCSKQNFCLFLSAKVVLSVLFLCMTQTRGLGLDSRTDLLRTNELLLSSPPANRRAALRSSDSAILFVFFLALTGIGGWGGGTWGISSDNTSSRWSAEHGLTCELSNQKAGQKRGGKVGALTSVRRSSLWWRHCHVSNWFKYLMWNCPWPPSRNHVTEHMFDKFENYFLSF